MTHPGVSGIVLAGGRSSRFGSDKLAAQLDGVPLLDRAVAVLADAAIGCTEIVIVLAPGDDRELPEAAITVRRAVDPAAHGGPLVGLLAGLEAAREPIVLVVGGDMPTLSPEVLAALVRALTASEGSDAAVLLQRGVARPLPAAFRNGAATQVARRIIGAGERSLVALLRDLATRQLAEGEWRGLDRSGDTLRDVDRPEDLPESPRT